MTREEALQILDTIPTIGEQVDALEMAIQALSQEPCRYWQNGKCNGNTEVCDDAISREDAEQMFRNIRSHLKPQDYKSAEEFNTRDLMLLNAEQMIHALPSVTQKSVLEQIRAEIEAARYGLINDGLDVALRIIDKHTKGE